MKHIVRFPNGLYLITPTGKFDGNWSGVNCTTNISDATAYDSLSTAEAVAQNFRDGTCVLSMTAKSLFRCRLRGHQ